MLEDELGRCVDPSEAVSGRFVYSVSPLPTVRSPLPLELTRARSTPAANGAVFLDSGSLTGMRLHHL